MSRKEKLVAGYKGFRAGYYIGQKKLYEKLGTKGQSPKVMLIACSDSRVDPTDIFDAYPGEMFVTRNVANICLLYTSPSPRDKRQSRMPSSA